MEANEHINPPAKPAKQGRKSKPKGLKKVDRLTQLIAAVERARNAGFTLDFGRLGHETDRCIETLELCLAQIHLPPGESLPWSISAEDRHALATQLPDGPWSDEQPHRNREICRILHSEIPDRFSSEWLEARLSIPEAARNCAGIERAVRDRLADAKRVALHILKAGAKVEVDQTGDLHIERTYNPFAHVAIGKPFSCDLAWDVAEVEPFGYEPSEIAPLRDFDGIGFSKYPRSDSRIDDIVMLSETYETGADGVERSIGLYYQAGLFAVIRTQRHIPVSGETCERACVPVGHEYRDSSGTVHRMTNAVMIASCGASSPVTYLGPAAVTPKPRRATSAPASPPGPPTPELPGQMSLLSEAS